MLPSPHLDALRCAFSKVSISFLRCGHQTGEQYSRIGIGNLTDLKYLGIASSFRLSHNLPPFYKCGTGCYHSLQGDTLRHQVLDDIFITEERKRIKLRSERRLRMQAQQPQKKRVTPKISSKSKNLLK